MSQTFRSLQHPNYRLYFSGALVSNVGTWMSRVAQDWLVLTVLTPGSSLALGIVTALQFLPMLLLAPYGGVLADRFSKRRILQITQAGMASTGLLLAILTATGTVELWHVYAIAFVFGCFTAVDNPARQAFVSELVPADDIPNAVGLNSASFNFARLLGPGTAGLLIATVGIAPAFFINTATFAAVIIALRLMKPELLSPSKPIARKPGQLRAGLRYVRGEPQILLLLVVVFFFGTFCMNFQITNALMATQVFHKGAAEYGVLGSIMAIGSLSAALLAARRKVPSMRVLIAALVGFGFVRDARGPGAHLSGLRVGADPAGTVRADGDDDGERLGSARRRPADARAGDGALHGRVHGRHADRRPDHRLGGRDVRCPMDDPDRRRGGDS